MNSMKKLILLLTVLRFSQVGFSQNQWYSTTIYVLHDKDSLKGDYVVTPTNNSISFLKTGSFTEGIIHIDSIQGENRIHIYCENFNDTAITINETITRLHIKPTPLLELNEITIKGHKPFFTQTNEGLVMNIEGTQLAQAGTSTNAISRLPGIQLSGNKINVFGKGEAILYIDGKQSTYERAMSIPSHHIKQIALITEPSAKYDAKTQVIINILLKDLYTKDSEIMLTHHSTLARHFMHWNDLNVLLKKSKLMLDAGYSLNGGVDWMNNSYTNTFVTSNGTYTNKGWYEENTRLLHLSSYRIGTSYRITERTNASLQYNGLYNPYQLGIASNVTTQKPGGERFDIDVKNNGTTLNVNHSVNFNLNHLLDTNNSSLFIGAQYNNFENKLYDQINEKITINTQPSIANRINDGLNTIKLYVAQADLVKHLSKSQRYETGFKYSFIENTGAIDFMSKTEGENNWINFPEFANRNKYHEQVLAGYFLYKKYWAKWHITTGLRTEYTAALGQSNKFEQPIIDSNYINIFPSTSLKHIWNLKWSSVLSYAHKISRPLYQDLDPFVWYIDSLTSIQGNSALIPELQHCFNLNTHFTNYTFRLSYVYTKNAIKSVMFNNSVSENSVVFTKVNIASYHIYQAALELPYAHKQLNGYMSLAVNFNQFIDPRPAYTINQIQPQIYCYSFTQFDLKKWGAIEISGEYYGKGSDGITQLMPYYYMNLGYAKQLLKQTLTITLSANDVFKTAVFRGERTIGTISSAYNQRYNIRFFRIALAYTPKLRKFDFNHKNIGESEFNRIKQ